MIVTLKVRLPWWRSLYFGALKFAHDCGVLEVDPDIAAAFIIKHARLVTTVANPR